MSPLREAAIAILAVTVAVVLGVATAVLITHALPGGLG